MKGYNELTELLKMVQATGGLDIDEKSIVDYQDMIGHSSDEQLTELSNGVYKEAFYRVYGAAYGVVQAIRFHCSHGDKITNMLRENDRLNLDIEDLKDEIKQRDAIIQKKQETAETFRKGYEKSLEDIKEANKRAEAAEAESIQLKAKLYDLMTA